MSLTEDTETDAPPAESAPAENANRRNWWEPWLYYILPFVGMVGAATILHGRSTRDGAIIALLGLAAGTYVGRQLAKRHGFERSAHKVVLVAVSFLGLLVVIVILSSVSNSIDAHNRAKKLAGILNRPLTPSVQSAPSGQVDRNNGNTAVPAQLPAESLNDNADTVLANYQAKNQVMWCNVDQQVLPLLLTPKTSDWDTATANLNPQTAQVWCTAWSSQITWSQSAFTPPHHYLINYVLRGKTRTVILDWSQSQQRWIAAHDTIYVGD